MENIIEIKNLVKSYGELKAVDDISFCVRKGQSFAFLGSNGAGKSTTINMICGILDKDSGEITINGFSAEQQNKDTKKLIGVVFQNSVLDKKLSVYENLYNKALLYGIKKEEIRKSIETLATELDFKSYINKPIEKLSGGQSRRIDIARALVHNPEILILDEPTTGLDPQTRVLVWKFLNKLKQNNFLTMFLTTHYMEEASDMDYIVILDKGKIVAQDTPGNLKNQYANDFIKIYDYEKLENIVEFFENQNYRVTKHKEFIEIEINDLQAIKALIIKYPQYFNDFEVIKGKMDDVFLRVTGKQLECV